MTPIPTITPTSTSNVTSSITFNVDVVPGIALLVTLVLGSLLVIVLYRAGWKPKRIGRVKVGEIELERDSGKEIKGHTTDSGIAVSIEESEFQGNVGDIGGVIIKGDNPDSERIDQDKSVKKNGAEQPKKNQRRRK